MVQAENVEETSKHFVLGRFEVPSITIERNRPLRNASLLLYPESYHDGN